MKLSEAIYIAASLHAKRPDQWTKYEMQKDGKDEDDYCVKRIRFCMVETVAN